MMQHLTDNFLKYTLTPLFILMVSASYYRFLVLHNYLVSYEASCDPEFESCFVLCENEAVEDLALCPGDQLFYYAEIERYGEDLINLCGDSVTDCEAADYCVDWENDCTVSYCDPNTETISCDTLDNQPAGEESLTES